MILKEVDIFVSRIGTGNLAAVSELYLISAATGIVISGNSFTLVAIRIEPEIFQEPIFFQHLGIFKHES